MIGIFDSGVGGLHIAKAINKELPRADLVYLADEARAPYGSRSPEEIERLSSRATRFLIGQGAKMIVVACNTATCAAIDYLRQNHSIPFVGVVPAVKVAAKELEAERIGVICTEMTAISDAFEELINKHCQGSQVAIEPCPDLVKEIEADSGDDFVLHEILKAHVDKLVQQERIQALVLGCTHFTFVIKHITKDYPELPLLDAVPAVARQTARVAERVGIPEGRGRIRFWSTANPNRLDRFVKTLWPSKNYKSKLVNI